MASAIGENRVKAVCEGYSAQLAASLAELRHQDTLCDVTIHVENRTFRAHRAILAASSSYFMGMFTRGFAETHQEEITIEGNAQTFESLLEFAYTGQLPITDVTAYDIITMANYMQFMLARDTALKYVRRSMRISPEDAFRLTQLDFLDNKLINRLQFYLVSEMKELETSHVFLQETSSQYMMELMERKDLTEVNETEVMRTLVAWLHYNWETRKAHVTPLLKKVHFDKVSKVVLQEMITDDVLEELQTENELLKTIQLQMQDAATPESDMSVGNTITAPIKIGDTFQFLYYFADDDDASYEGRCWRRIPRLKPFPGNSAYAFGTHFAVVNGTLYAKTRYPRFENFLYQYDPMENKWNKLGHINSFENIWLVYVEPFLYSIDGRRDTRRYDIHKKIWEVLQSVPTPYFYDVIVSTFMGKILLYGEVFEPEDIASSIYKLQVYDPEDGKWMEGVCEKYPAGFNTDVKVPPLIFEHQGSCYRVMFKRNVAPNFDPNMDGAGVPIVREFVFNTDDGALAVELGEEECQDLIPPNLCGAFRIADDVFVSWGSSFVLKTGLKAWEDKWDGDVNLGIWDRFRELEPCFSNVVMFTFDKELLMDEIVDAEEM